MHPTHRRVLIAVDGSVQSINAAYYIGRLLIPEKTTLTLFLVENLVPEVLWDTPAEDREGAAPVHLDGWWESIHIKHNRNIVGKIRDTLIREGFPEASVEIKIRPRNRGIARDIIEESQKGYDLVVAGRIGHNIHTGAMLGNCARKLITAITHTSLAIVGGLPDTKGVLIGFDGSDGSRKCLKNMAEMMSRKIETISMCYVSRPLSPRNDSLDPLNITLSAYHQAEQTHQKNHQLRMRPRLQKAEAELTAHGFSPESIHSIILRSYPSRSEGLIEEAKKHGCTTLMVGRRGHSCVEAFFLGRVGDKLIQLAQDRAIWLVS